MPVADKKASARYDADIRNHGVDKALDRMRSRNAAVRESKDRAERVRKEGIASNLTLDGKRPITDPNDHQSDSNYGDYTGFGKGTLRQVSKKTGRSKHSWIMVEGKLVLKE